IASRNFELNNPGILVANLYNLRSSRRFKRLSLRQIVQSDPELFTSFFPIVLTSPDLASNLFKGMDDFFDIVMFDEASQLRLEDNLPAILKGKQVIIAGDEHQMPPSNYFSKLFDGTVDDEDDIDEDKVMVDPTEILLSCESLLDFASELNFRKQYLDFHYRSRHPFLIDFSNAAFYNKRLQPLPQQFDYIPIKYIQVSGTFLDSCNEVEAEMVLSIIDKNINKMPNGEYPSVGIATFNIAQRDLIKNKIVERQRLPNFDDFNSKIQDLEKNGFFVKNLENIQGDERDVVILSTTYGFGMDGKFAQRFGPINHAKGYKLLNVIITRAKYKIYCVTSIPEATFMNYKDLLIAEGSNNRRGVFYAYLAYCKAVSESDAEGRLQILTTLAENTTNSTGRKPLPYGDLESPFEEEVYDRLRDHYGDEKLFPQLQFAGFRIDIVYDSGKPSIPKIAIECDGAKYHSSREAYLHDIHRQRILEDHGFVFHRIWSTNWWRNAKGEMNKLIRFINEVENAPIMVGLETNDTAVAFTDDIETIHVPPSHNNYQDVKEEKKIVKKLKEDDTLQTTLVFNQTEQDEEGIKLGSYVDVKYLNNGAILKVQLVSTVDNPRVLDSEKVQKIYYKSPL